MIPLKLQLRNFMSYRDGVPPLLFDGFKLACLSGENGHGKSALLDAITWALWGRARAKSEDELIHFGRTEMEVEFEFMLGESRYCVLRKRALKKRGEGVSGVGSLDLQIFGEEGYRSIAGNTMHETQRRLNDLLHMNYETFVNSALILQGKADAFTLKSPSERKQVLADLLGLDAYDAYEERARDKAREAEAKRREEIARRGQMEAEVAHRPEYEAQAAAVATELEGLAEHLGERDRLLVVLREEKHSLEKDAARLQEVSRQLATAEAELAESEKQVAAHARRVRECEAALAQRDEVEAGYAHLLALRGRQEELNAALKQLVELGKRRSDLARTVEEARSRLAADQRVLASAAEVLEQRAAGTAKWRHELEAAQQELAGLAGLEERQEQKRAAIQSLAYQSETLRAINERITHDGKLLGEKLDLVRDGDGRCPVCASELGHDGRSRLAEQFTAERQQLRHDYKTHETRLKEMEAESAEEQKALQALQQQAQTKLGLERTVARLEKALADAAEAQAQAVEKRQQAGALQERLDRRDYAAQTQTDLAAVEAAVAALGYDAREHEAIKTETAKVAVFEERRQQLAVAESTLAQERPQLASAERLRARWTEKLNSDRERRDELSQRLARLPQVAGEMERLEGEIGGLLTQQTDARLRQGRCQQLLNNCLYLEKQCQELAKTIGRLAEEKKLYDDLALAFGKKGIQAMIIDSAVPELEDESNLLLSRMTDGRMRLKFETQRAAKTSDAVIETLDIRIADELGTRAYELFSGGEAFKVNFAMRIALSKLLARRAGARLELLIIDEGFGTQDAQGRERLVEAINAVSQDFAKILVITHIEELKDAFPVRIDVTKTAEGSQFTIS
ncbi:MAG: AAA family ATPase [Chloroflexota bacterium]